MTDTFLLGSKIGFEATNKWPSETTREWGRPIAMSEEIKQRVDEMWDSLGDIGDHINDGCR